MRYEDLLASPEDLYKVAARGADKASRARGLGLSPRGGRDGTHLESSPEPPVLQVEQQVCSDVKEGEVEDDEDKEEGQRALTEVVVARETAASGGTAR